MVQLFGIPVSEDDARSLVTTLLDDRSPYAVAAARTIHHGLNTDAALVALTVQQRDAILAVLQTRRRRGWASSGPHSCGTRSSVATEGPPTRSSLTPHCDSRHHGSTSAAWRSYRRGGLNPNRDTPQIRIDAGEATLLR